MAISALSKKEIEVLELIASGISNEKIAEKLGLSYRTIENHLRSIYLKLEVDNRTSAAVKAIKNKLIDLDSLDLQLLFKLGNSRHSQT